MKQTLLAIICSLIFLLSACSRAQPEQAIESGSPQAAGQKRTTLPAADSTGAPAAAASSLQIPFIERVDLGAVPDVDTSVHTVPLDEIIFDTFRSVNRAVPLPRAQPALIRSLMDAIPPLYEPRFSTAAETDAWLDGEDLVLGYADGEQAFAYPIKILNFHEMASHEVNGRHILASYCPLCRSGIVYDRVLPGADAPLLLGNTSALYESDMVMFDHQTGSYWNQVSGEAIVGPLSGQRMAILPSQMTTWSSWKTLYPDSLALSENTGFPRNYRSDPFAAYGQALNNGSRFLFPVSEAGRDPRLGPGDIVLGLKVGDVIRAYALAALGDAVVHDRLNATDVVLFIREEGPSGAAYLPQVEGRTLSFLFEEGHFLDRQTGSLWNLAGHAVQGELAGAQLEPLAARSTFWFSLVANYPEVEVYQP